MNLALLNNSSGIPLQFANRHGTVTGQTGTGKTVTLMRLAESFASEGVPVFISDAKGDISPLSQVCRVEFLDCFAKAGKPVSVPISAIGAASFARVLELTEAQAGTLEIAFSFAADNGISLTTIAELRAILQQMAMAPDVILIQYGNAPRASIGAIQRALIRLESEGGQSFFRNPQFDVVTLLDAGKVSILQAQELIKSPRVYSAFLLYVLNELWDRMPEVGDVAKPRLVLFFDESHLLFQDASPALVRKIEQTVRLIRSKGIGVYFVSQSPDDLPARIRAQCAHTIEHDRALGVGAARFSTLTAAGMASKPAQVQVSKPSCDLQKLAIIPTCPTFDAAAGDTWANPGKWQIALMIAVLMAFSALIWGIWHLGGYLGIALAGIVFVGLLKAR